MTFRSLFIGTEADCDMRQTTHTMLIVKRRNRHRTRDRSPDIPTILVGTTLARRRAHGSTPARVRAGLDLVVHDLGERTARAVGSAGQRISGAAKRRHGERGFDFSRSAYASVAGVSMSCRGLGG